MFENALTLETFYGIFDRMTEGVLVVGADGNVSYANTAIAKSLGKKESDLVGTAASETLSEGACVRPEGGRGEHSEYEIVLRSASGDVHARANCLRTPQGVTVWVVLNDVAEPEGMKESIRRKMAADAGKKELVSLLSHELRTPLTVLKGYLSMILDGDLGEISLSVRTALESSFESSNRMIELVNDVLDLSKETAQSKEQEKAEAKERLVENFSERLPCRRKEDVDVRMLVNEIRRDMDVIARTRNIRFGVDTPFELGDRTVFIDRNRIKQLIVNLINNAFKFTPENGSVTLLATLSKHGIRFGVRDTGVGIPKDKLEKVFEKFYQAKNHSQSNEHSLGLGLALCQSIAEKHGSKIEVFSEEGKGSEFSFEIRTGRTGARKRSRPTSVPKGILVA